MGRRNTDLVREQTDMAEYVGTDWTDQQCGAAESGRKL